MAASMPMTMVAGQGGGVGGENYYRIFFKP